ncbi:protein arginine kinase [Oceanirhabdus sp. W0125-5]|uniref:protein arginine kinase n=1 Tax=Oceanirhabdus sp. W0125-5 TaxID=2999116 RepID=UPI0022F2D032|nr:protein arginine kinase [Oceanirhabdus sp. W0125-5]WBW97965.1 protein arginine kinase [Oceanirhabdus sp. W0125-5]
MENWISSTSINNGIVISSRIRLARNFSNVKFPHRLDNDEAKEIIKQVEAVFYKDKYFCENFKTKELWSRTEEENIIDFEKHLISKKLLNNSSKAAFIVNKDETVSIMINEEDHIRIQCITAGFNLEKGYDMAEKIDDLLESGLDYAFNEKIGYVTACPSNCGTGIRASVMLHLPALTIKNEITRVMSSVSKLGMTIRGLFGEGSNAMGQLYQLSNQVTIGLEEKEIIKNLSNVVKQIIYLEKSKRNEMDSTIKYEFRDKIFRALGTLKYSRMITYKEAINHLSYVRLGVEMGIIEDINYKKINNLLVGISDYSILKKEKEISNSKDYQVKRAEIIRKKLNK